ncbi:pyridine nucleotide transhydrogenase [Paenibacillus ferrarius]|uniref:Pyridine nucleotide transhydrogenase n=1 Tax=Paenibacillus ferrarius TaxID=1469647 RepID=A0A1V4HFJ2_9BACL|nr:pyridine nucleotide transhydrogenase [Paenibacillus ferrarius]OPH53103.1 pyridine nucleotide transhydrogenase [Paenibacillus ferrarius]
MSTALIGFTGFVGSSLIRQTSFDYYYNSKNIEDIRGKKFSMVICAGVPAVKWKANQEPDKDLENIQMLMSHLSSIETEEFVLISTVDVYKNPIDVNEETAVTIDELEPYGKHRFLFEGFIQDKFVNHSIIRLPGLFGVGLKKNIIYDLMHNNCLHLTHHKSVFQFYDMSRLWNDIQIIRREKVKLINFSTEPITAYEIARNCFGIEFTTITEKKPVNYNMKSLSSSLFNLESNYMLTKEQVFEGIRNLIRLERIQHETGNF